MRKKIKNYIKECESKGYQVTNVNGAYIVRGVFYITIFKDNNGFVEYFTKEELEDYYNNLPDYIKNEIGYMLKGVL